MKAKLATLLLALTLLVPGSAIALNLIVDNTASGYGFLFVENTYDDNNFVTPTTGSYNPRLTGSNKWTGKKGAGFQQSLGYLAPYINWDLTTNQLFDMWLENGPVKNPLLGLRCINHWAGCNFDTSLILPEVSDENGFYGVKVPGYMYTHGMLSPSFYSYLRQMAVGERISFDIYTCEAYVGRTYDASKGERCKDLPAGGGEYRKHSASHVKAAHLRLSNTNAIAEVFISSDGNPIIGEGSIDCKMQVVSGLSGIMCKMVEYELQLQSGATFNSAIATGMSVNHAGLNSAVGVYELQFSLDGNSWYTKNATVPFATMRGASTRAFYVFFSNAFFKKVVSQGISSTAARELINFTFINSTVPESGWYEFSTSNDLIIKPRDFSISIVSDDLVANPHREGYVGRNQPALDFGYIVTTSGKTQADEVKIKAIGPTRNLNGTDYCIFTSDDGATQVPFPAELKVTAGDGTPVVHYSGCSDRWFDMTDALWSSEPWNDASGNLGVMSKTRVNFRIPMSNPVSEHTTDGDNWMGSVSASGEIHVEATWRNIK